MCSSSLADTTHELLLLLQELRGKESRRTCLLELLGSGAHCCCTTLASRKRSRNQGSPTIGNASFDHSPSNHIDNQQALPKEPAKDLEENMTKQHRAQCATAMRRDH